MDIYKDVRKILFFQVRATWEKFNIFFRNIKTIKNMTFSIFKLYSPVELRIKCVVKGVSTKPTLGVREWVMYKGYEKLR